MKVISKLRWAFALYITLLAALLTYHVSTIQGIVTTGQELTQISSRVRATSTEQLARIAQLGENAAKYWVTQDPGYFDKFDQLHSEYDTELRRLSALQLSDAERHEMTELTAVWDKLGNPSPRLRSFVKLRSTKAAQDSLSQLQEALDVIQLQTQRVGEASQATMSSQLESSERAAREAERLSWISAIGVLLLTVVISALIARSISEPLQRLKEGTHEVAAGQFDYRLDNSGGDEFAQVARDFNTMTERLGELDRMKRDFVSKVSHDLKTPLSSMQETISVLLDDISGPLTAQQRTLLELHQQSATRLSSMLAKLLDLSRLESGIEPDMQMVDAAWLLQHAVNQIGTARIDRGLNVEVDVPTNQILVESDADRMLQLLENLLENAVKFSPPDGTIRVELLAVTSRPDRIPEARWGAIRMHEAPSCAMFIAISDSGPGISDDQKERVFTRFYQTDAGRSIRGRGVGLGLTICREIVSTHGGTIWVSDNADGGTVFNVLIPGALSVPRDRTRMGTDSSFTGIEGENV